MKKIILMAIAILLTCSAFAQQTKKHQIFVLPTRATTFGEFVKINDFFYVIADSTLYCSKVAVGPNANGTYLLASTTRYNVANMAVVAGVVTASSGTFSTTLDVTGTGTFLGALRAAGAVGLGTSYNKFTVAAATGNTAIAGTLPVSGATITLLGGNTLAKTATNANSTTINHSLVVTDSLTAPKFYGTAASVATTLTLPGTTNTVTKTTGNANSVSFAHSVRATDTIASATVAGTTRVLVGTIPLTASTGKVAADSLSAKRVVISDTLQGLVLYSAAGTKYRLRVTASGNLTLVVVP